ncbi:hypothetical protein BJ322DRAFT_1191412 [Thelephora terrestris]|uniref:Uncharacterized protein n=1 Tax=Thelephora terrestris TaxID=56493 RepID=A0A9P6HG21_9AGAM|nr:hypothetical protein BJ322DRAFT_1191412 [Thelephora terrestris]
MLPLILSTLSTLSPDVQEIQIERLFHSPSTEEASSELLMRCNPYHLRKYNVDSPISAAALRHIIQLPSLEKFWLVVDTFRLLDPLPVVLLPAIKNPVLTSIFVECSAADVAQLMEAFQLTAATCGIQERLQEFRVRSQEEFKISPEVITCTLPFKNLMSLQVLSECSTVICQTFDLTDDHINLLTKAMPRLESLAIGEEPCRVPSQITFKSLYTISNWCTWLANLQIHFNPASFVTRVDSDSETGSVALGLSDLTTPAVDLSLGARGHLPSDYIVVTL